MLIVGQHLMLHSSPYLKAWRMRLFLVFLYNMGFWDQQSLL
jgi:hypothetical protein